MSVFVDRDSRFILQGFTGQHATFHAEEAMANGTQVVGGVTPGKGGTTHLGLPVFDSVEEAGRKTTIIGPNSPGIITPGQCKVGIMPSHIYAPGRIGVVSRSGTLNYEAVSQMGRLGLGQSTCVGIGGDPVNGVDFRMVLQAFEEDDDTDVVVMIGEIGGPQEVEAARWASQYMHKPVVGFVAGLSPPPPPPPPP